MNFMFLPLEHKIHIFSPPCNILYVVEVVTRVAMVMELVVAVVTSVTVVVVVTRVAMVMLNGLLVVGHMRGSGGGDGDW